MYYSNLINAYFKRSLYGIVPDTMVYGAFTRYNRLNFEREIDIKRVFFKDNTGQLQYFFF